MIGIQNSNVKRISIQNPDGSVAGTITITKSSSKKKKKFSYSFKQISAQIMRAKTSSNARQVMAKAKSKTALLRRQLKTGEYDETEIESAIIHAMQMERIAKKKMRHLQEEEAATQQGGACQAELDEEKMQEADNPDTSGLNVEEIEKLMQELQDAMEEMEEMEDVDELDEWTEVIQSDMDPEDLDLLKKKHRSDELREIMQADMKYLKAVFEKLERERQEAVSGGVSLELGGIDVPISVPAPTEEAAAVEGGSIDTSV